LLSLAQSALPLPTSPDRRISCWVSSSQTTDFSGLYPPCPPSSNGLLQFFPPAVFFLPIVFTDAGKISMRRRVRVAHSSLSFQYCSRSTRDHSTTVRFDVTPKLLEPQIAPSPSPLQNTPPPLHSDSSSSPPFRDSCHNCCCLVGYFRFRTLSACPSLYVHPSPPLLVPPWIPHTFARHPRYPSDTPVAQLHPGLLPLSMVHFFFPASSLPSQTPPFRLQSAEICGLFRVALRYRSLFFMFRLCPRVHIPTCASLFSSQCG